LFVNETVITHREKQRADLVAINYYKNTLYEREGIWSHWDMHKLCFSYWYTEKFQLRIWKMSLLIYPGDQIKSKTGGIVPK